MVIVQSSSVPHISFQSRKQPKKQAKHHLIPSSTIPFRAFRQTVDRLNGSTVYRTAQALNCAVFLLNVRLKSFICLKTFRVHQLMVLFLLCATQPPPCTTNQCTSLPAQPIVPAHHQHPLVCEPTHALHRCSCSLASLVPLFLAFVLLLVPKLRLSSTPVVVNYQVSTIF